AYGCGEECCDLLRGRAALYMKSGGIARSSLNPRLLALNCWSPPRPPFRRSQGRLLPAPSGPLAQTHRPPPAPRPPPRPFGRPAVDYLTRFGSIRSSLQLRRHAAEGLPGLRVSGESRDKGNRSESD